MERRRRERGTSEPVKVFLRFLIGSINYPKKILQSEGPTKYVSLWKSLSSHSNCLKREASVIGNVNGTQSFNTYFNPSAQVNFKNISKAIIKLSAKANKITTSSKKKKILLVTTVILTQLSFFSGMKCIYLVYIGSP